MSLTSRVTRYFPPGEAGTGGYVSCKLYVADLSDSPAYTALSYMWGRPHVTKIILVNDQLFEVRENLYNFLYEASNGSHPDLGPMWIDAICIEQASIPERNHQVSVMGELYSNAMLAISWLGLETPDLSQAIGWLNDFTLQPTKGEVEVEQNIATVRAVRELYDHDYWKRLWIIQEVVLARDVQVWCGRHHLSLLILYSATKQTPKLWRRVLYTRIGNVNLAAKRVLDRRYSSHEMRMNSGEGTSPSNVSEATNKGENDLCSLLKVTGLAHCEDPRDGLFGILSILSPSVKQLLDIQPDYSKDREAIVLDVVDKVWIHLAQCDTQEYHRYMYWIFKALKLPQVHLFYQLYSPAIAVGEDRKKYYELWKKKQAEELIGTKEKVDLALMDASIDLD
jgi:hypothetical protein